MPRCFGRQEALLFDEPIQIGACYRPGITLIFDESMHDGDGAAHPVLLQFDRPEESRRVWEWDRISQEAPFDLRIDTRSRRRRA